MGVKVSFTPIYGCHSSSLAICYLLSIDSFNILLDCGWSSSFDISQLENLAKIAPTVNAVLLSHPDTSHVGALPYALTKLNLKAPVFSTLPVWRMALMYMYDNYLSMNDQIPFEAFNLDDVDAAFDLGSDTSSARFTLLKYQQHFPLNHLPGAEGIVITPHPAGHLLGGAVWHISKRTENILYAVHINHRRERHLNPTTLTKFTRPSHLIISSLRAQTHTQNSKPSDIVDHIRRVTALKGNVLIPVDTAGRLIELSVHLNEAWQNDSSLSQIPLIILHQLSSRTFDFARSMIEWMSDEVVKRFDISRENLFIFKNIKLYQSMKQLQNVNSPMVVLASSVSMELGFSRQLFRMWCSSRANAVILTDVPEPDTLYGQLYRYCERKEGQKDMPPLKLKLVFRGKESLQGEELEQWREEQRALKAKELEEKRLEEEKLRLEQEAKESTNDGEADPASQSQTVSETEPNSAPEELELTEEEKIEAYDQQVLAFLRKVGGIRAEPCEMFSFTPPPKVVADDYGQVVDTTQFMIGEDPGEGAPSQEALNAGADDDDNDEEDNELEQIPTKYVENDVEIMVNCQLFIVDCAGLADGDSLKRIVKEVEPRHVTIVAGNEDETGNFKEYILSNLRLSGTTAFKHDNNVAALEEKKKSIAAPKEMETVDITSHTSVFEFTLLESLVKQLQWNEVGNSSLAFLDGAVSENVDENGKQVLEESPDMSAVSTVTTPEGMDVETDVEIEKSHAFEDDVAIDSAGHPTVYVGTIMLNQFKEKLSEAGIKAEFAGGALCVENVDSGSVVLLKKTGPQEISLDGALSEEYLVVKDLLYKELVVPR